jgi:hypothetical protein
MGPIKSAGLWTLCAGLGLFAFAGCQGEKPKSAGGGEKAQGVSLSKEILPLFVRSCGACHKREGGNEHAIEHGKFYETKADILANVGKFVIAGKPGESGLVKVVNQTYPVGDHKVLMPPPESGVQKFSAEDVALFEKWIGEGAKDN